MKKLKVTVLERFISPFFWNDFRGKKYILEHDERTINEKQIEIENDPKTKVIVFGSWEPYAYEYSSYITKRERDNRIKHLLPIVKKGIRKRKTEENKKFNRSLNVPVKWSVEIKQVLSGLSEGSWGNGQKRNTVYHIYLHEDLVSGRLKREANNFLCSPVKSKWGGNWSGTLGDGSDNDMKVSCKKCLEIAKRFNNGKTNKKI